MRLPRTIIRGTVVLLATAFVGTALWLWRVCAPHVVSRAYAPDGTELRVVQRLAGPLEFTTEVFIRRPGGPWGLFYYDLDDHYWGHGRAEVDPQAKRISLYRDGELRATFDWESGRYRLLRPDWIYHDYLAVLGQDPPL